MSGVGKGGEAGKRKKRKWVRRGECEICGMSKLNRSESDSPLLGVCIDRDCEVMRKGE